MNRKRKQNIPAEQEELIETSEMVEQIAEQPSAPFDKVDALSVVYCQTIPETLDNGTLYISEEHHTAIHLCPDGSGIRVVTPIKSGTTPKRDAECWHLIKESDNTVTLQPSVLTETPVSPAGAHYFIRHNKIDWC